MLLSNFPQGSKSFKKWSQEVSNAAKLINYVSYDWQQAAVDAIILQTSARALQEGALQENVTYDQLFKIDIAKEQSAKGATLLEQASGQQSVKVKMEEEVRRLQSENKQLKSKMAHQQCYRCGGEKCLQGSKCPANGQKYSKCKKNESFLQTSAGLYLKARKSHHLVSFPVLMSLILKSLQAVFWLGRLTYRPLVPKLQYKDC